jgi:hypothetical protein
MPWAMGRKVAVAFAIAAFFAPVAGASQLIDRNATGIRLEVSRSGYALLTYRAAGKLRHVLAFGATDAIAPVPGRRQVAFQLDYSGGWGTFRRDVWKTFKDTCQPYDGPELAWFVTGCRAPDGSYWALQSWQRELPDYGLTPSAQQASWELRLSHWTTALPVLTVRFGWAYRRYQQIYGTLTYRDAPVFGFHSTSGGAPLDTFGRNVYVDTYDSAYGSGWHRENSFLVHRNTGGFCYGFYPHGGRPSGRGTRYRATVIGPGVTPDVTWLSPAPGSYDRTRDQSANRDMQSLLRGDSLCRPH